MISTCVQLPLISAHTVEGRGPELVKSLALQRVHTCGVAKLGVDFLDRGCPIPGYLVGVCDGLIDAGLLALADPDPYGLRRLSLTDAGHAQCALLRGTPWRAALRAPDPQFPPRLRLAAGRAAPYRLLAASRIPALGPGPASGSCDRRCPDGRLHLLATTEVVGAATRGHAQALCGCPVPVEGLTITHARRVRCAWPALPKFFPSATT